MTKDYNKLSKEISYALRHAPWEYELELEENGWVLITQLLNSLQQNKDWKNTEVSDLNKMIENSDKKRHEIKDDKIRALYGHSTPMKIVKEIAVPPTILYHGTSRLFIEDIQKNGLLPMSRQYIHLSEDIETAILVGKRKDSVPVILSIDTVTARNNGVNFYLGNEKVWLADKISPKYIQLSN